jgi:hypothetical protein
MSFANYLGLNFCLLTFENFYTFSKNVNFVPTIGLVVLYLTAVLYKKKEKSTIQTGKKVVESIEKVAEAELKKIS